MKGISILLHVVYLKASVDDDGAKIIPREEDVDNVIKFFYDESREENALKLWERIGRQYTSITRPVIQRWINCNEEHCRHQPMFENKDPLKPVQASGPMNQLQIDLVDMSHAPCTYKGRVYKYIFAALDVFSRYVMLLPMEGKSAPEAADCFKRIFMQIGLPKTLQSDQGSEFKGKLSLILAIINFVVGSFVG